MQECPLEKNNYIDHTLFTKSSEDCRDVIQKSQVYTKADHFKHEMFFS